ncbi:MAG TPA: hypothetical protein VN982_00725 [Candidatus Dormibacteraeota bacterium]|nr:hypothetical protein [Candidatus Dormibacteraeota bacterium]
MRFRILILLVALLGETAAWSHGDQKHMIGTVERISSDTVSVKTGNGKTVEIKLMDKTVYLQRDGKSAKLADVGVGDRVVIHATSHGDLVEATEVKFSKARDATHSKVKSKKNP